MRQCCTETRIIFNVATGPPERRGVCADVSRGKLKVSGIRIARGAEPVVDVGEIRAEADFLGLLKKGGERTQPPDDKPVDFRRISIGQGKLRK
ncbi:MAG TPA: hypothetical protein VN260_01960 [Dissulfurispiraceae bacterium]|nr:hypothetical protein [Dissulfurispiraceae bacterium]